MLLPKLLPIPPLTGICATPLRGSNYGIETTSKIEWLFVVSTDTDAAREQLQLERWPAESEKMKDRTKCRVKRSLTDLDAAIKEHNKQLEEANQPKAEMDEVIAAQLYTGPVSAPLL